jgi:hypothetical protein
MSDANLSDSNEKTVDKAADIDGLVKSSAHSINDDYVVVDETSQRARHHDAKCFVIDKKHSFLRVQQNVEWINARLGTRPLCVLSSAMVDMADIPIDCDADFGLIIANSGLGGPLFALEVIQKAVGRQVPIEVATKLAFLFSLRCVVIDVTLPLEEQVETQKSALSASRPLSVDDALRASVCDSVKRIVNPEKPHSVSARKDAVLKFLAGVCRSAQFDNFDAMGFQSENPITDFRGCDDRAVTLAFIAYCALHPYFNTQWHDIVNYGIDVPFSVLLMRAFDAAARALCSGALTPNWFDVCKFRFAVSAVGAADGDGASVLGAFFEPDLDHEKCMSAITQMTATHVQPTNESLFFFALACHTFGGLTTEIAVNENKLLRSRLKITTELVKRLAVPPPTGTGLLSIVGLALQSWWHNNNNK